MAILKRNADIGIGAFQISIDVSGSHLFWKVYDQKGDGMLA
jgi:hypothetical protein